MPIDRSVCRALLLWVGAGAFLISASAQTSAPAAQLSAGLQATAFEFAGREAGRQVLGAVDGYVRVTTELERRAKTRSAAPVSPEAFVQYMRATAQDWSPTERQRIEAELPALKKFINTIAWSRPGTITFVRASAELEDDLPHTRGMAIVLPDSALQMPRAELASLLAHEVFHILTRHSPQLKERAYQLMGFERCQALRISPGIEQAKITNPDTPLSEHTIAVRYQGRHVQALPFIGFRPGAVDTTTGFKNKLVVRWLLVQRENGQCTLDASSPEGYSAAPQALEGLFDKIGQNTLYLFHAEEILAENFVALFMASNGGQPVGAYPSPRVLESLRSLLLAGN
jgi:hypothetical protein